MKNLLLLYTSASVMLAVSEGEGPPPTTTTPTCAPCKNILDGPSQGEYMLAPGLQPANPNCASACTYEKNSEYFCFLPGPYQVRSECISTVTSSAADSTGTSTTTTTTTTTTTSNDVVVVIGGVLEGTSETFGDCNLTVPDIVGVTNSLGQNLKPENPGAAVLGENIFYCGGYTRYNRGYKSDCFMFDGTAWVGVDSMKEARAFFTMNTLGDKMIATGGYTQRKQPMDSMEVYMDGAWRLLDNVLTSPRSQHCAVSISDTELLVIGGNPTKELVEKYNVHGDMVERLADLPTPRYGHACTLLDNEVWLTGGIDDDDYDYDVFYDYGYYGFSSKVEIFNLSSRTWRTVESMKEGRYYHTAAAVNGTVAVYGGSGGENTMELYTPGVGWVKTTMEHEHSHHASVVVPCPAP